MFYAPLLIFFSEGVIFLIFLDDALEEILVKNSTQFGMILSLQGPFKTFEGLLKFSGSWEILKDLKNLEEYPQDLTTCSCNCKISQEHVTRFCGFSSRFFRFFKIFHASKNCKRSFKILNDPWRNKIMPNCVEFFTRICSRVIIISVHNFIVSCGHDGLEKRSRVFYVRGKVEEGGGSKRWYWN